MAPHQSVRSARLPRDTGPFPRFALREHHPESTMDEVEASMMMTTSTDRMTAEDAAMAASHTHQPELSPTRVERADPDQSASAEKPRKWRRACLPNDDSEDDAAMAAANPDIMPNIAEKAVNEEARVMLLHSRRARERASALQQMMTDAAAAAVPTPMPTEQSVLSTAADAIAAAISARPGEAAVRSSPPREHIRIAPHLQPAATNGGWQAWEKRGGASASTSTSASAPPSPHRAEAPGVAGIATSNRFDAIAEEPRVSHTHSRGGRKGGRLWKVVVALLIALTETAFRGTNASHEWHDQPELTPSQVTPFSSQELQGTWAEFEKNMGNHGMDTRKLSAKTREVAGVWKMRSTSRLAGRIQASSDGDRTQGGSGLQQQRMLTSIPESRTHTCAAEVYRWRSKWRTQIYRRSRERGTHTYAHARKRRRRRVAHVVRRRNTESPRAGIAANSTLTDTHHWHTQNILWLEGRLPWHRVKRNA